MQPETNEGIAYLMALKRSAGPAESASGPEDTPASQMGPQGTAPQDSYQGVEKRRSPRYKTEGSAEMCEAGCEVRTWATFTDISMHGCYVEAQATYPVGSVLHLKLEANGRRVEAIGNVRVSYPYLGMGIAFAEVTEENRARLKELLLSISRPCVITGPEIPSSLPPDRSLEGLGPIAHPEAAIQALVDFFGDRQTLMWDDFSRIVRHSQTAGAQK